MSDTRQAYRRAMIQERSDFAEFLLPEEGDDWRETILGDIGYPNLDGLSVFTKFEVGTLVISDRGRLIERLKKSYELDALPLTLTENGRVKLEDGALVVRTTPGSVMADYLRFRAVAALMLGAAWHTNSQRD